MSITVAGLDCRPRAVAQEDKNWRDIDRALARWVLAHGGPDGIATAAAWASLADGHGDAALMLDDTAALRLGVVGAAALRMDLSRLADDPACGWIARVATDGDGHEVVAETPFALDGDAFYLRRNLLHEIAVAHHLRARLAPDAHPAPTLPDDDLAALFEHAPSAEDAAQRDAVRRAPGHRLFVLTGGPGTGKTTTVLRMLLTMAHRHAAIHHQAPIIRLAAPTGKAAQRLGESLRNGEKSLREKLPAAWCSHLDTVLAAPTDTLHRLLEARGLHGFQYHSGNRLPADIVVVDESSMLDLAMLRALLDALPDECALVLVGDADQLASIDTGCVLTDVVSALEGSDALVRLHHSFRTQTALVAINAAVRAGDAPAFDTAWTAASTYAVRHRSSTSAALQTRLRAWGQQLHKTLHGAGAFALHDDLASASAHDALAALKQMQLLCALREGPFGVIEANVSIEQHMRDTAAGDRHAAVWYPGRAVIVRRNDAAIGLFNGDVGLCLRLRGSDGGEYLRVVFDPAVGDEATTGELRAFDPDTLPAHETAFALTVHKSQGSEYDRVAVLLPPQPSLPLLTRQLLYTALSRARSAVELWSDDAPLDTCLRTPLQRAGQLVDRIKRNDRNTS